MITPQHEVVKDMRKYDKSQDMEILKFLKEHHLLWWTCNDLSEEFEVVPPVIVISLIHLLENDLIWKQQDNFGKVFYKYKTRWHRNEKGKSFKI